MLCFVAQKQKLCIYKAQVLGLFCGDMKILIVEPDTNKQRQLRTILTSLGHKSADVETTNDKKGAISLLRKKRFDCAFADMDEETVAAIDLVKDVRSGGSSRGLPIILYSAVVTKESVLSSHDAGARGFLAYPFSVSTVEAAIAKAASSSEK